MQQTNIKLLMPHIHDFRPRIVFDYQDNDYMFGLCWCGEKDM